MNDMKLKPCPFCGGEVELEEYYESTDGRQDRHAKIRCYKCDLKMGLTFDEFYQTQHDFGYTGGYYSKNEKFWNGMHQRLVDKWNRLVKSNTEHNYDTCHNLTCRRKCQNDGYNMAIDAFVKTMQVYDERIKSVRSDEAAFFTIENIYEIAGALKEVE